ncbi:MAG: hypothetical protein IAE79_12925 [Anaerolinea sp.]|nr:hypothetical protein [Anaerolinea sp.]
MENLWLWAGNVNHEAVFKSLMAEDEGFAELPLAAFIERYRQQGPEPGAPCMGGIGPPI